MRLSRLLAAAAMVAGIAAAPAAAIINAPVPDNATIVYAGLRWAWASPIAAVDLSYQSTLGWRLPTASELANAPSAMLFKYAGANVPLGGTDPFSGANFQYTSATLDSAAALATPYFSNSYSHGDWCNAPGSACGFGEIPWAGQPGAVVVSESLVVNGVVPEPESWALMIAGFGMVGAAMRRRARVAA